MPWRERGGERSHLAYVWRTDSCGHRHRTSEAAQRCEDKAFREATECEQRDDTDRARCLKLTEQCAGGLLTRAEIVARLDDIAGATR